MIAAEDDPAVFAALFAAAEGWLRERGRSRVQGPFNLSINEETGLLIEGFNTPPMIFMSHDAPYRGGADRTRWATPRPRTSSPICSTWPGACRHRCRR